MQKNDGLQFILLYFVAACWDEVMRKTRSRQLFPLYSKQSVRSTDMKIRGWVWARYP